MSVAAKMERLTLASLIEKLTALTDVNDIGAFKASVAECHEWLESAFVELKVDELVSGRAMYVDALLNHLWALYGAILCTNVREISNIRN